MARRPSTAAALLLLALSLLAVVAHCRPIEAESEPAESNAVVVAVSDEDGAMENPTLPAEAGSSATKVTVVQPAEEQEQHGGFLRLPSQGHRRPCRHGLRHRRHGWVRHQIFSGDADAPRRFRSRHGEERLATVLPAEEVKAVAEPDPDRSLPDSDGEGELASTVPSFGDADGARGADDEAVKAWKKEMLRRWVHLHSQFGHHGMRHHHRLHHGEQAAEDEVAAAAAGEGVKRFHHRRHHDDEEDDEEKETKTMGKRFRPAAEKHDEDSDDEEEVEEMVRRFRKAVMRRTSFGHGRRFHHRHHGNRDGEEAEKAPEESGVMTWIKGLMNRF